MINFYSTFNVNSKALDKKTILGLVEEEKENLIPEILKFIRETGLNILISDDEKRKEYGLLKSNIINVSNGSIHNFKSHADILCKIYCPEFHSVKVGGRNSLNEAFLNDEYMIKVIRNKLGMDVRNGRQASKFTMSGILNSLKSMGFCLTASVFKSTNAKTIYERYSSLGDSILDYSAGWGARMLGAASCGRKYIGVDPLTGENLKKMALDLKLDDVKILCEEMENVKLPNDSIDFAFSSPPYYDFELYSGTIGAQIKNEQDFYGEYWHKTVKNCFDSLKFGKYFGVNIRNCPKMIEIAEEYFGPATEEVNLITSVFHSDNKMPDKVKKAEKLYIFKK